MVLIQETFINRTQNCMFGESEPYEPWTTDVGKLFKSLQQEYGRCISKAYVDRKDGKAKHIGWVFEKRMRYDRGKDTYIRQVWVTLLRKIADPTPMLVEYIDLEEKGWDQQ